jgi:hypothetical protein
MRECNTQSRATKSPRSNTPLHQRRLQKTLLRTLSHRNRWREFVLNGDPAIWQNDPIIWQNETNQVSPQALHRPSAKNAIYHRDQFAMGSDLTER